MSYAQDKQEAMRLNYINRVKNEMEKYKCQINRPNRILYHDCNNCC
jgi:hypothetical protein